MHDSLKKTNTVLAQDIIHLRKQERRTVRAGTERKEKSQENEGLALQNTGGDELKNVEKPPFTITGWRK